MGTPFAAQKFDVIPDISTMAKALTNGSIPMGGVTGEGWLRHRHQCCAGKCHRVLPWLYLFGASAACAAGIATQKIYEDEGLFKWRANDMSAYFLDAIWSLKDHPLIADLRGIGMMAGVEVKHDGVPGRRGTQLQKDMFWNGLHKFTGDVGNCPGICR